MVFGIIALRLFYIQIVDSSYKRSSANNSLRYEVQYPPRGVVYDRNGEYLIQSKEIYDLMIIPGDVKPFDTTLMCRIVNVSKDRLKRELRKARNYSWRRPSVLLSQISKEAKLRLDELNYPGFYVVLRTARSYPRNIAGNLLGYVGEVNDKDIQREKINTEYYGFDNPRLKSITGGDWAIANYPHIVREDRDELDRSRCIEFNDQYYRLELVSSERLGFHVLVHKINNPKYSKVIFTVGEIREYRQRYRYGNNKGLDHFLWKLYDENRWYYADNDVGYAVESYRQRCETL